MVRILKVLGPSKKPDLINAVLDFLMALFLGWSTWLALPILCVHPSWPALDWYLTAYGVVVLVLMTLVMFWRALIELAISTGVSRGKRRL